MKNIDQRERPLSYVESDVSKWPIYRLSLEASDFRNKLVLYVMRQMLSKVKKEGDLSDILSKVLYKERQRYKTMPWSVDPADEDTFWDSVKKRLFDASKQDLLQDQLYTDGELKLLEDIVTRYCDEITAYFNPSTFDFASNTVKKGVARLLNASPYQSGKQPFWDKRASVYEKVPVFGPIEKIRELAKSHTIVVVPTHSSNMDSPVIGWLLRTIGLSAFMYGAGLNLFNFKLASYFMSKLGAYKVDRRKKNQVYIEALQAYSMLTIHNGAHSLFFPGGTRSRSGKVETKLKYGLLGTTIEAQRQNLLKTDSKDRKVIIVTANINYPFVLEAPVLIDQFLKIDGKSRYLKKSEPSSAFLRYVHFFYRFFRAKGSFSLSLGEPMDVFGNALNDKGESVDKNNRVIKLEDYYSNGSEITRDIQRDEEYTKELGAEIVRKYLANNIIMPVHLITKSLYQCFLEKYQVDDVYDCIKQWNNKDVISHQDLTSKLEVIMIGFQDLEQEGKITLHEDCKLSVNEVLKKGLKEAAMYHLRKPVLKTSKGYRTENIKTLYYYNNRTEGYSLR